MTAVAVPGARSQREGKGWPERLKDLRARAAALARPVRAPLVNLAASPLHVAGLACIDAGSLAGNVIAGLVVTGFSLIWLEHVIADEP